jgi:hypothetical protein
MTHTKNYNCLFFVTLVALLTACKTKDTNNFQQALSVKTDTLQLDNSKDTLLVGSKGTALFFQAGSLVLPDGSLPKGTVTIQLKECYNLADIVRENLSTSSNGKLLETRGMIYVKALADNQELQLKEGKKFIIHFPKDAADRRKQMNLFYGSKKGQEDIDWSLDSATLLRPTAFMRGWMTTGYPGGDSTREGGFYFKGEKEKDIFEYFYKHFDNLKLQPTKDMLDKSFAVDFKVTKEGKISNLRIDEERYDSSGKRLHTKTKVDPYFFQYVQQLPTLEPYYYYEGKNLVPFNAECSFYISMGLFPPDYRNNETYNKLFNEKYAAFKNSAIRTMNDAELSYFIFSASKLGWINCDFFWNTQEEKIDYIVKADPDAKPNMKLIFKQARSIMAGTLNGDNYIFKNVPANQEVKVVSISYKNNQPLLAVTETKTSKRVLDKLEYKEFTVRDLESQLNAP